MSERKFICKIITGSRLFGTNNENSDTDYYGVYLPSTEDLFGMTAFPGELSENTKVSETEKNNKDDVDCKFFSLQKFLQLASAGQPSQLEMMFAPSECIVWSSPEWELILEHREDFLSKKAVSPFVGFALAQAHRTVLRGQNLNRLRAIVAWGNTLSAEELRQPIKSYISSNDCIANVSVDWRPNEHGFWLVSISGSDYDGGLNTKTFINNLKEKIGRYGERTNTAAENGFDWKSLMHAYRMVNEAEEFLTTSKITLPRPEAKFLKQIRAGEIDQDHFSVIMQAIDDIKKIEPDSKLPERANLKKINQLCIKIMSNYAINGNLLKDRFTI